MEVKWRKKGWWSGVSGEVDYSGRGKLWDDGGRQGVNGREMKKEGDMMKGVGQVHERKWKGKEEWMTVEEGKL